MALLGLCGLEALVGELLLKLELLVFPVTLDLDVAAETAAPSPTPTDAR